MEINVPLDGHRNQSDFKEIKINIIVEILINESKIELIDIKIQNKKYFYK